MESSRINGRCLWTLVPLPWALRWVKGEVQDREALTMRVASCEPFVVYVLEVQGSGALRAALRAAWPLTRQLAFSGVIYRVAPWSPRWANLLLESASFGGYADRDGQRCFIEPGHLARFDDVARRLARSQSMNPLWPLKGG